MLEKIGLPARPSARGRTWVIDASSCQTCQGVFTLFNRKVNAPEKRHLMDVSITVAGAEAFSAEIARANERSYEDKVMPRFGSAILAKKLEEAARFQLRNRGKKVKTSSAFEDDLLLRDALGDDAHSILSEGQGSGDEGVQELNTLLGKSSKETKASKLLAFSSSDATTDEHFEQSHLTPEQLRSEAAEQKNVYASLKKQGKHDEALQAFKRSKELGREADALELSNRKMQRKAAQKKKVSPDKGLTDAAEAKVKDASQESKRVRLSSKDSGDDELLRSLKDLGWDEADLAEKKSKQGPVSDVDLLAEISDSQPKQASGKTSAKETATQQEILGHKRKALALKREGKIAEGKEELRKAKLLEKKLEEMALLGEEDEEEEDDELALLMKSLEKEGKVDVDVKRATREQPFDLSLPSFLIDDDDTEIDVTDDDVHDPSIAAALKDMGWEDEAAAILRPSATYASDSGVLHIAETVATETSLQSEVLNLKRQALVLKRENKIAEAKSKLQEAKVVEKKLEELRRQPPVPQASKLQGRKSAAVDATRSNLEDILADQEERVEVGEEDERDPEIMAALLAMGYEEENTSIPLQINKKPGGHEKKDLQNEILSIKRSALVLRKSGNIAQAKEELAHAKELEQRLQKLTAELEADGLPKPIIVSGKWGKTVQIPAASLVEVSVVPEGEENEVQVTADDFKDPELVAAMKSVGWRDEDTFVSDNKPEKEEETHTLPPVQLYKPIRYSAKDSQRKLQLQKDLLSLKRKALNLKREGKSEEAKADLRAAKVLERELEDLETAASTTTSASDEQSRKQSHFQTSLPAPIGSDLEEDVEVSDADMQDPELLAGLNSLGWRAEASVPAISRSSRQPEGVGLDSSLSLKNVLESCRLPESTPEEVSRFGSKVAAKSYENPPYRSQTLPDLKSKYTSLPARGGSVEEFEVGTGIGTRIQEPSLLSVLSTRSSCSPTPPEDVTDSTQHQSVDLLSGDKWTPTTEPAVVTSDSEDEEPLFDADIVAALQSIGLSPPVQKPSEKKGESTAERVTVSKSGHTVKDDRTETDSFVASSASGLNNLLTTPLRDGERRVESVISSAQTHQSAEPAVSLQDEIKMRKKKALTFKREGKLSEAREELRQAKMLEKQLEAEAALPDAELHVESATAYSEQPTPPAKGPEEKSPSNASRKEQIRQGKDRSKLQRESLAHKRKALALRREGKMEEAEAEFEQAKTLERQMEELDSSNTYDHTDAGLVESLLDPQLMAALKGIGWNDADMSGASNRNVSAVEPTIRKGVQLHDLDDKPSSLNVIVPQRTVPAASRQVPVHTNLSSISQEPSTSRPSTMNPPSSSTVDEKTTSRSSREAGNVVQEKRKASGTGTAQTFKEDEARKKLEDKIKQEKLKALQLKRSGQTREALDAFKSAKQLEKQLQSISS